MPQFQKKFKVTNTAPYDIYSSEQTLPHHMQTHQTQPRANKSSLLQSNLHTVNIDTYTPQCPLCLTHTYDTNHFFNCSQVPTQQRATYLWKKLLEAAGVIQ